MSKLNKIIAGLTLAAALLAGGNSLAQNVNETAADNPAVTLKVISDPGGGGGH